MTKQGLIALTGGIGAGKSVVARILRAMGYPVFDCDSEAKALMDADEALKGRLAAEIAQEVIVDGRIDRHALSAIVFADAEKLAILNSIVHHAVAERLVMWFNERKRPAFVETAILYQSGLNNIVDCEWRVDAPLELRINRVKLRSGLSREQIMARIQAQLKHTPAPGEHVPPVHMIINDGTAPILPQVRQLLDAIEDSGEA